MQSNYHKLPLHASPFIAIMGSMRIELKVVKYQAERSIYDTLGLNVLHKIWDIFEFPVKHQMDENRYQIADQLEDDIYEYE